MFVFKDMLSKFTSMPKSETTKKTKDYIGIKKILPSSNY